MKKFRKIWDEEKCAWLLEHRELDIKEAYGLFMQEWPQSEVTLTAFNNQRSRVGAIAQRHKVAHVNTQGRQPRDIGAEHCKKGYVRVKIGQPNVWMFKHWKVWEDNHPGEKLQPKVDTVIFLDMNNRNFDPDNLMRMPRRCMAVLNNADVTGGMIPGDAEGNRVKVQQAINYIAMCDFADAQGLTDKYYDEKGHLKARCIKFVRKEKYAERCKNPDFVKAKKQRESERYRAKMADPETHKELLEYQRERNRERRKGKIPLCMRKERKERLLYMHEHPEESVMQIAARFHVSSSTVYMDRTYLEVNGLEGVK